MIETRFVYGLFLKVFVLALVLAAWLVGTTQGEGATQQSYQPGSPIFENGVLQPAQAKISVGDFSIGRTGAAIYNIPITVPPGTAGMQPDLALTYNSQAGNGLVGVGWGLTGLSAIRRCRQTIAQDGQNGAITYTSTDRFCLGGGTLVAVSGTYGANGTEYRTERDTFVKVTSHNTAGSGPEHFLVKTKDGRTLEYGKTMDSRIEAPERNEARVWALNKVQDTSGNYMTVSYLENDGDFRPDQILYTMNTGGGLTQPSRRVLFVYETRSDVAMRFVGGAKVETKHRLTSVQTFAKAGGTEQQVRDYRLEYDTSTTRTNRSRVVAITECVTSSCHDHEPFEFVWQDTGTPTGNFRKESQTTTFGSVVNGDFNGDGRVDFLSDPVTNFTVYLSIAGDGGEEYAAGANWGSVSAWDSTRSWRGDFNGDGLTDMLTNVGDTFHTYFSTGTGFGSAMSGGSNNNEVRQNFAWLGDLDGDGRSDIITLSGTDKILSHISEGNGTYTEYTWTRPNGASWSDDRDRFWVGDINGDKMADLVSYRDNDLHIYLSQGDGTYDHSMFAVADSEWSVNYAWVGDFNGDGLVDLVSKKDPADDFNTYFSKGDGTFTVLNYATPTGAGWAGRNVWVGDFNGDGLTDLMSKTSSQFHKYFSAGNGGYYYFGPESFISGQFDNDRAWTGDVDGDGLMDVVTHTGIAIDSTYTYFTDETYPDLLTSITNPLLGGFSITYKTLADSTVYTKDDQAVYPTVDVALPIQVVAEYTAFNGCESEDDCGQSYDFSYEYEGLKFDLEGRGNLGFGVVRMEDLSGTDIERETFYLQEFPFEGRVDVLRVSDSSDGRLLSEVQNTWVEHQPYLDLPVSFAALAGVDILECDGATNCRMISRTMEYDDFGNHEKTTHKGILSNTGDEYVEETVWAVDETNWLHRPTTKMIKDFDGTELRRSWFYYDGNNTAVGQLGTRGLRTREEHDLGGGPGHVDNPKTTVVYDTFANRQSVTDPVGCVTSWVYDSTQTFPTNETTCLADNTSQATTTFEWDERWGVKLSETDANSNETEFRYDDAGRLETVIGPLDTQVRPLKNYTLSVSTNDARYHRIRTQQPVEHGINSVLSRYEYFDGLGRVWSEKSRGPNNAEVMRIIAYDSRNLVKSVSDTVTYVGISTRFGDFTNYTYDPLGRPKEVIFPDGTSITTSYSLDGTNGLMIVEVTDQLGNAKRRLLDAYGRVARVEEDNVDLGQPVTYVTEYSYNALGQLLTTKNHLGHVSTIAYDKLGRKTRHDDPDTGEWHFTEYDKAGNLKSQTDAKGQTVTFDYDLSGRIIRKSHGDTTASSGSPLPAVSVSVPLAFNGTVADRVGRGKTALAADGGMDGVFTVTMPDGFGAKTVTSLKLTRSSGGQWNTNPATTQWVVGAAMPPGGALANAANGGVQFAVSSGVSFNVYAADDAVFPLFTEGLTFALEIGFSDGSSVLWDTTIGEEAPVPVVAPAISLPLAFNGTVADRVGRGKTALAADGGMDGVFTVTMPDGFGAKTVTSLKLTRSSGGQWNTNPATTQWVVGAAMPPGGALANAANGGVQFAVSSGVSFNVYAADDAVFPLFTDGLTFVLEIGFSDGSSVLWDTTIGEEPPVTVPSGSRALAFNGTSADRVGRGETAVAADGGMDGVFTVTIPIGFGTKKVTSLALTRSGGGLWNSTGPQWVVGAAATTGGGLTNASDGSVNFDVSSGDSFEIFVADDPTFPLFTEGLTFALEVRFWDGSSVVWDTTIGEDVPVDDTPVEAGTGPSIVWTYDDPMMSNSKGRLTEVADLAGSETYEYDEMGRISESVRTIGAEAYSMQQTWNALNKLQSKTFPDGDTITYEYNPAGWLAKIPGIVDWVWYNPRGQIEEVEYANGNDSVRQYYQHSFRLKSLTVNGVQDLDYVYNAKGSVTTITDYVGTASRDFTYDNLDRLIEATGPFGGTTQIYVAEAYRYDPVGNFTEKAGVIYEYDENNNRVHNTVVDGFVQKTFEYDANGNMTESGSEHYTWDADNRLISVNSTVDFRYDYTGRRVRKDSVLYPFADYEIDASGIQKKYFTVNGELVGMKKNVGAPAQFRFYHTDHLGGAHVITGEDRLIDQILEYDPWGRISRDSSTLDNVKKFTSQEYDEETHLYYYVGRYYDPVLGRFTRPDPFVGQPFNPQNLNRYSYVLNNPTGLTDPSGFQVEDGGFPAAPFVYDPPDLSSLIGGDLQNVTFQPYCGSLGCGDSNQGMVVSAMNGAMDILFQVGMARAEGTSQLVDAAANAVVDHYTRDAQFQLALMDPPNIADVLVENYSAEILMLHEIATAANASVSLTVMGSVAGTPLAGLFGITVDANGEILADFGAGAGAGLFLGVNFTGQGEVRGGTMQPLRLINIMVGYAASIGGVHTAGVSLTGAAAGGGPVIGGGGLGVFVGPTYSLHIGNTFQLFPDRR